MPEGSGITEGRAVLKRGKLIKVWARFANDRIDDIRITGDFFLYPEDRIEELENALREHGIEEVEEIAREILEEAEVIGIDPESIAEAVREAWKGRS